MTDSTQHNQSGAAASEPKSREEIRAEIEQTREELGDTVEALAAKTDVTGQAKDRIANAKQTITGKTEEFSAKAKQATPESASAGAQQLGSAVKEHPLPTTAVSAFVAGLIIGWILGRR